MIICGGAGTGRLETGLIILEMKSKLKSKSKPVDRDPSTKNGS